MKKVILSIIALVCCMSVDAQVIKLMKGTDVVATYTKDQVEKILFEETSLVSSIALNQSECTIFKGNTKALTATILPEYATNKTVTWNTSNASVATVADGVVTAVEVGTANITATANDGSGVSATCAVTITDDPSDSHEYVDLGLPSGTLWATCNVGASKPEECGDHYTWCYNSYYKYSKDSDTVDGEGFVIEGKAHSGYIKYVMKSDASRMGYKDFYDNISTLEKIDDIAAITWGGTWRMPTKDEFYELKNKCTWTWVTYKNKNGFKIVGPNGNYIFLIAAGYRGPSDIPNYLRGENGSCHYWTASLANNVCPLESEVYTPYYYKYNSSWVDFEPTRDLYNSVRPVRSK